MDKVSTAGTPVDKTAIRNAATIILYRRGAEGTEVLMGQRGASAAFMPNKFVFPGGAVDAVDATVPFACGPDPVCAARLAAEAEQPLVPALLAAAVRELWEETGLILGVPGAWPTPAPRGWRGFAASGHLPSAEGLRFVYRAITPPGRPRRFDARFFLAPATRVAGDVDDFSRAEDELSLLQWIPLTRARSFDLPFITEVVLGEVAALTAHDAPPDGVPFVRNDDLVAGIRRLR
ncbi:NUDIX hydrolase [Oceanicola sp. 502str15]|uniref:NUDIX hydrolase n=1 Tax=Oceanicola sp. 502str15 TaxID=2696061 RepID=UPI00209613D1|nr:NUDIX hydrolase [Oceanicola sp. 502str15]MCO6382815.1 NUDIX domain-containing protein [Oceanicola sp. 502str15]